MLGRSQDLLVWCAVGEAAEGESNETEDDPGPAPMAGNSGYRGTVVARGFRGDGRTVPIQLAYTG